MKNASVLKKNIGEIESWTGYWQTGAGVSCISTSEMESQLSSMWEEFVDGLSDGSRILDLATGNGIVPRNCAAKARLRKIRLNINAVDAANIHPESCVADPGQLFRHVCFQGGIKLEALPFADSEFSGVVSQFGFEYAEEKQAIAEVSRVLSAGGKLRLVIHAKDGAISRDISKRLERLNSVLAKRGPVKLVLDLASAAEMGDKQTLKRKLKHLPAAVELTRRLAANPLPDDSALFYSSEFINLWNNRKRYWPTDLQRSLMDGWVNAKGTAIRQAQMHKAARSRQDISEICTGFNSRGLEVTGVREIYDHDRNIQHSWMIDGVKCK